MGQKMGGKRMLKMNEICNMGCMQGMAQFPDKYFDLAIADPPYGLGNAVVNSGGRFKRYENKNGNWDMAVPDDTYFKELFRVSKNQIIWGGNYFNLPPTKCFLIWDKQQPQGVSFASCEFAWTSLDGVAKTFYLRPQGQQDRFHPTQKPVELYTWLLQNYAKQGYKILDTHLGSASSIIACIKSPLELEYIGFEIDKEYFDLAQDRINTVKAQSTIFDLIGG